jgi:hypothetical protein
MRAPWYLCVWSFLSGYLEDYLCMLHFSLWMTLPFRVYVCLGVCICICACMLTPVNAWAAADDAVASAD